MFWWEDAWAAIALLFEIICLFGVWSEAPACAWYSESKSGNTSRAKLTSVNDDPNVYSAMFWLLPLAFTCVLWCVVELCMFCTVPHVTRAARMSTIYPVLRVTDPRDALRWIVYAVISCFAVMWTALIVQKVLACVYQGCNIGSGIAIADLVSQ
jgi:hypothetical protein